MVQMSLYRLQDSQGTHLVGQDDVCHHVELITANPPPRISVQQVEEEHDLVVLIQVRHVMEKAIKLQIWKTVSSQHRLHKAESNN